MGLRILNQDPDKCQGKNQKQILAEIKASQSKNFEIVVGQASDAIAVPIIKVVPVIMDAISEDSHESSQEGKSPSRSGIDGLFVRNLNMRLD